MKIFFTTAFSLGALFLVDTHQNGRAMAEQNLSPNIHLVRGGGGHVGGRGFEGHHEGAGGEGVPETASRSAMDTPAATAADRSHTLENRGLNNLRHDEGWGAGAWGDGMAGCAEVDVNGNCINYQGN